MSVLAGLLRALLAEIIGLPEAAAEYKVSQTIRRGALPSSSHSLFQYLDAIHARPGMYTGVDSTDRGAQLDRMELLIHGYMQAVLVHRVRDLGVDRYGGFSDYLERRFGWNLQFGPIRAIRRESGSDELAWDRFWALLSDLRGEGAG
jgi:hypothetical protein